jgi:RimJ/RimL family protein N-acetyltransferase
MPRPVPILHGRLITLRPLDPAADAGDYFEWNRDPEMHVWTGNTAPASLEEARRELQRFAAMDDATMWAIADNAGGDMIGRFLACLERRDVRLIAGDGIRLARPFWRTGRTRQARRLAYGYAFDSLGADCIETQCWTENANSRLSILQFGFHPVQERLEHDPKRARPMSMTSFRLTRDQWREIERLQGSGGEWTAGRERRP